ncbi:MAG: ankyrin repeat domain-containing protein, partial [Dehalococcoidia bacterium]
LFHAASGGHADIVRLLLKHGASPETSNGANTALMIASRFGHVEVVKALIEGGVNVGFADRDGYTALDNAEEHPEIVALLKNAASAPKRRVTEPRMALPDDAKKWWQFWK